MLERLVLQVMRIRGALLASLAGAMRLERKKYEQQKNSYRSNISTQYSGDAEKSLACSPSAVLL